MARPKRIFTEYEEAMIANYALDGGKNNTIAMAMDMPVNTLTNRFTGLLKKYRSIRKLKLAREQTRQASTSPQMAIFLGKNELGQVDKQEIRTETAEVKSKTGKELNAVKAAAKAYNEAMSKGPEIINIQEA